MSAAVATQTPPADELAQVRAELKALEERESALRGILLSDPSARTGNHYLAEIRSVRTARTDLRELRAAYPREVEEHTHCTTVERIELRAIDADTGEITPVRRRTA